MDSISNLLFAKYGNKLLIILVLIYLKDLVILNIDHLS